MAFHVRPLGKPEVPFATYEVAKASADVHAHTGTQASVYEVGEDGSETLLVTCCRRTPVDQGLGQEPPPVQPSDPLRSPFAVHRRGPFVFVDPRNKR